MNNEIQDKIEDEKRYVVYKHTSPSEKVYIGITSQNPPEKRWMNGTGYRYNRRFNSDILKFGWSNFLHEILFSDLTKDEAQQKEIELIDYYKSSKKEYGYNIIDGDNYLYFIHSKRPVYQFDGNGNLVGEYENTNDASLKTGFEESEIRKCCNGIKRMFSGYIWSHFSDKLTDEYIKWCKDTDSKRGKGNPVCQYNLSGELINIYSNLYEAERQTGISMNVISKCCNHGIKVPRGYIWRYLGDDSITDDIKQNISVQKMPTKVYKQNDRPVIQYSVSGEFIKEFKNAAIAGVETNICNSNIYKCCKGDLWSAGGYIWKYSDEDFDFESYRGRINKRILQYLKNGELMREYNSIVEASIANNIDASSITKSCRRKLKTAGGYIWRYADDEDNEFKNKDEFVQPRQAV